MNSGAARCFQDRDCNGPSASSAGTPRALPLPYIHLRPFAGTSRPCCFRMVTSWKARFLPARIAGFRRLVPNAKSAVAHDLPAAAEYTDERSNVLRAKGTQWVSGMNAGMAAVHVWVDSSETERIREERIGRKK